MFENIRKHSKIVMFLLFLLIIPSFVLVGVDNSYFSEKSPVVARVNGEDINQMEWDNAHRMETDRIRAQSPTVDPKFFDTPQARYATLERMVRDRVLAAAAKKQHLVTTDAKLASALQAIPAIADLRRADGTLDAEAYRTLVGSQGLTPEGFEANVRNEISVNQVMGSVMNTAFGTNAQVKLALDALYERRDVQVARFKTADFSSKVTPTDAELKAYYDAHTAQFQQLETADVEYVLLDMDSVRDGITLSEGDLRTYYTENLDRLSGKEERRASHILINATKDASSGDREKAKARAEELLAEIRKAPASFAEVAKKSSEDTGSAPSGGDLNFFSRGAMVKPFEDAAFAMNKGDISDVVESDFGYHIIQLTDIKKPPQPSFEQVRASLETELKQQQAQRKYAEVAEAFANGVYEQADSLKPVVEKLGLKLQTASGVTRTPPAQAQGPLADAKFLEALFSNDSLENKRNTEAIEIGSSLMVSGRVTNYTPAKTLPFDEVRAKVTSLFVAEKAAELARKEGETQLAAWKGGAAPGAALAAASEISREQTQNLPRELVDAALSAPAATLPAWAGVSLGSEGYAVVKVNRVIPRTAPDEARAKQESQQYAQWLTTAEGLAYYELLKQRFKVQIKAPRPASIS